MPTEEDVQKIHDDKSMAVAIATKSTTQSVTSSKAMVGGGIAAIVTPLSDVLHWFFMTYVHMPEGVSYSAGMVICGLIGYFGTYYIPNNPKE